jgi:hypothetical protein
VSGDPIVVTSPGGFVSIAAHGIGTWSPHQIASNVAELLLVIAAWLEVWDAWSGDIRDNNCDLRTNVRSDFRAQIRGVLSEADADNLMHFFG